MNKHKDLTSARRRGSVSIFAVCGLCGTSEVLPFNNASAAPDVAAFLKTKKWEHLKDHGWVCCATSRKALATVRLRIGT